MKIILTRTFIYTILMGILLSTNSYAENAPEPIPIDFGVNGGMRDGCEACNTDYNPELMGASCCDEAIELDPLFTCEILETGYYWNCSGCDCSEWDTQTDGDNWGGMDNRFWM